MPRAIFLQCRSLKQKRWRGVACNARESFPLRSTPPRELQATPLQQFRSSMVERLAAMAELLYGRKELGISSTAKVFSAQWENQRASKTEDKLSTRVRDFLSLSFFRISFLPCPNSCREEGSERGCYCCATDCCHHRRNAHLSVDRNSDPGRFQSVLLAPRVDRACNCNYRVFSRGDFHIRKYQYRAKGRSCKPMGFYTSARHRIAQYLRVTLHRPERDLVSGWSNHTMARSCFVRARRSVPHLASFRARAPVQRTCSDPA
jgi:hypothetical protein